MGDKELSQDDIDALFNNDETAPEGAAAEGRRAKSAAPGESSDPARVRQPAAAPGASVSVMSPPVEKEQVEARPVEFSQLPPSGEPGEVRKIDFLLDVPVTVTVELGRTAMVIRDALSLGSGSVVELNKLAGEPVDLLINNKLVARGEVVVVNENFGVKVIDIVSPEERLLYLR